MVSASLWVDQVEKILAFSTRDFHIYMFSYLSMWLLELTVGRGDIMLPEIFSISLYRVSGMALPPSCQMSSVKPFPPLGLSFFSFIKMCSGYLPGLILALFLQNHCVCYLPEGFVLNNLSQRSSSIFANDRYTPRFCS